MGLFVYDLYTRDSKRGGAWMNPLISQSALLEHPVVVVNNHNVPKPAPGEPTLLTYDEVTTLFHEFGHALHGLFARVTYPKFAGTDVFRDFVEFPSQVNEMWMLWPEVLANYAVHHATGEPMPQELVDKLHASEQFNEGFKTSEYLAAALLDQAWHSIGRTPPSPMWRPSKRLRWPRWVWTTRRCRRATRAPTSLTRSPADTTPATTRTSGARCWMPTPSSGSRRTAGSPASNGDRFRTLLLGVGGSKDPLQAYREFRGRDAVIEPLLKRRGLEV